MLRSTYRPTHAFQELPEGWTEHKAPSGHSYYYNAATKQSTYARPTQASLVEPTYPPSEALGGTSRQQYMGYNADQITNTNGIAPNLGQMCIPPFGHNNYNDGKHANRRESANQSRPQQRDRLKKRFMIPGCEPWVLVRTKLGRRFVYNPDKNESYWKFPAEVMRHVVEFDRAEREKRTRHEQREIVDVEGLEQASAQEELAAAEDGNPTASAAPAQDALKSSERLLDSDGEEYEEVEVTDDEDEGYPSKRQKTDDGDPEQPVEFNEDDIAYQLAAMGEDYGLDPGEYGDGEEEELGEGAEGLTLTDEDRKALFKDMLHDFQLSPYTPWEKVIEAGHIIEDDRYTVLPNMKSRKEVWDEWSRDRIQKLRAQRETEEKQDPRIPYFAFLEAHATPKLYWPEFRKKYRNEPEMRVVKISDKDREKWYREYVNRLKLPEGTLRADLVKLLKATPIHAINRSTTIDTLPSTLLTDMRYISLKKAIRNPLIQAHINSLSPAPTVLETLPEEEEARVKEKHERERREKALLERQKQVENEKRRQREVLKTSKGMLREEEDEVQKAMRVGKEGLLGHINENRTTAP